MRGKLSKFRWPLAGAAVACFALACGLTALADPGKDNVPRTRGGGPGTDSEKTGMLRAGTDLSKLKLPVLPPIVVDYRNDAPSDSQGASAIKAIGGRVETGGRATEGGVAGIVCRFNADCDDCNPCTLDACHPSSCAAGPKMGYPCDNDAECEGVCTGGDNNGLACTSDLECCGTDPTPDGVCTFFTCQDLGGDTCINWLIPVGVFEPGSECDDALECNGQETCNAQQCVPGTDLCTDQQCDEATDTCTDYCLTAVDCDDAAACTIDTCDAKLCVGGADDGSPCQLTADCTAPGTCTGGGTGACVYTAKCGPDGACTEPTGLCGNGRCCDASKACTNDTYANCTDAGGSWLAVDIQSGEGAACVANSAGGLNDCPDYGSGIADQGAFTVEVGPVSYDDCDIERLGDDYSLDPANVTSGYYKVDIVRLAIGVPRNARVALEFWTSTGEFVEDFFFPDGTNIGPSGPAVITIELDPPLTIPATGYVAISVSREFGPNGALSWLATDAVDKGTNVATELFVNGASVSNFLGECDGGGRDGLWCDQTAVMADPDFYKVGCPSGTCNAINHYLAFELVGSDAGGAPTGACCSPVTGVCGVELPWDCRAANGHFQGPGTACNVCDNNPFVSCTIDDDCDVCVGGSQDGDPCTGPGDCPGGACTSGTCQTAPPACTLNACCDTSDGTCTQVMGGTCSVSLAPCINDGECPVGQTCEPGCPIGTQDQGFGTSCEPNCCDHPAVTGGDNCLAVSAGIEQIVVPAPGDPPVVVTFSGNNSTATFDDWNTRVCVGGTNDQAVCNPNFQCPGGGVCNTTTLLCEGGSNNGNMCDPDVQCPDDGPDDGTCTGRLCNSAIFDPDGATADPGWFEGFELIGTNSSCALVRIQLCCTAIPSVTGPQPVRPAWGSLYSGCPCEAILGQVGVEPPVGIGRDTQGFQRGLPFCPGDDNIWGTWRLAAPGTYFYPIYSAPQGTAAAPIVDGPGADYQMSVIVAACPTAACCGKVCAGGANAGQLCNEDADCPSSVCGPEHGCDVVNEFDCAAEEGFWLGGDNLPEGVEDPNVSCSAPVCVGNVCIGGANSGQPCVDAADCGPASCQIGSCCLGPGNCQDTATGMGTCDPTNPVNCIDRELCEVTFNPPGVYVGGATCDWVPPNGPCPICPIFEDGNCQDPDSNWYFSMDRAHPGVAADGGGIATRIADDFQVPAGQDTISQFCFQFLTGYVGGGFIQDCDDGGFVEPDLETGWEVRFYENTDGFPGAELANSPGSIAPAAVAKQTLDPDDNAYIISFVFNPPITVEPGGRYWVEWSGVGNANVSGQSTCRLWFQTSKIEGNDFTLTEGDPRSDWSLADNTFSDLDFGFCVSCGYETPPIPTGGCCECGSTCTDNTLQSDCQGITGYPQFGGTPFAIGPTINPPNGAEWNPDQICGVDFICEDRGGGACPGAAPPVGEACATAQVLPGDGTYLLSNSCSTGDGPLTYGANGCDVTNPDATGNWVFTKDVWFEYTSTCDGVVHVDTCSDNEFDVIAAVYVSQADPTVLPACYPPNSDLIPHGSGRCIDNDCGKQPTSTFTRFGVTGEKYLIRIGSQDYPASADFVSAGRTSIEVFCETACFPSSAPETETITVAGNTFDNRKVRHVAITAGDAGRQQAVRVTLFDLPAPHNVHEGRQLYVGTPRLICENAGQTLAPDPNNPPTYGCGPSGGGPRATWIAGLQETPFFMDWNGRCTANVCVGGLKPGLACATDLDCRGSVNIHSQGIVPSTNTVTATYDVQVVDQSCDVGIGTNFSVIERITAPRWGDVLTNNSTNPPGPPNNIVEISDVVGILNKFKNLVGAMAKARADVEPLCLDHLVQISDVTRTLDAFAAKPFPFAPTAFPFPVCP